MRILYFAWIRDIVGRSEELIEAPADISSVGDLLAWLPQRGEEFQEAFLNPGAIRVAVNLEFADRETRLEPDDEVALFPPVTGG